MISEKERKQIEKESKRLLEKFASKLKKIKNFPAESMIIRDKSMRKEGNGKSEKGLKQGTKSPTSMQDGLALKGRILANAKNKNKDFIIAREKSW